jgi:hypothetical protein
MKRTICVDRSVLDTVTHNLSDLSAVNPKFVKEDGLVQQKQGTEERKRL